MPLSKKAKANKLRIKLEKKQASKRKKKTNRKNKAGTIKAGIYRIYNKENKRCYYGSSTHISKRFRIHRKQLKNNSHHNKNLQKDWNAFGEKAFLFEILITEMTYKRLKTSSYKQLQDRIFQKEKKIIMRNAETCYNIWLDDNLYVSDLRC